MTFSEECHRRNVPTMLHLPSSLENGVRTTQPHWGGGGGAGADKAPRGGSGDIITATGPEEGLCGSGVSVSHFLLTSWKPLDGI